MKEKDLILLTAYTPDLERKNILLNVLKSIDKNKFDIMVSSHSSISEEALEYCNYFIYDKKNTLLFDLFVDKWLCGLKNVPFVYF